MISCNQNVMENCIVSKNYILEIVKNLKTKSLWQRRYVNTVVKEMCSFTSNTGKFHNCQFTRTRHYSIQVQYRFHTSHSKKVECIGRVQIFSKLINFHATAEKKTWSQIFVFASRHANFAAYVTIGELLAYG